MSFLVAVFKPLAYISLPIILLRSIAASSPIGRYYVRFALYIGTLVSVASCSIVAAAGMFVIGRRFDVNYIVARTFYAITKRTFALQIEVEGEEHLSTRPAVLMANHQSILDVVVVGRLMPKQSSIMAKKSLQYSPLGPFMTMAGAIFIDRGNNAQAIRSLEAAGETMKNEKVSIWMFPEGTRHMSEAPDMLPLKKGGFHLAINAGIPIIPIVTENYWRIYRRGVFDEGTIKVRVLPPISTVGLTPADVGSLTTRVRDQMLEALREISPVPVEHHQIKEEPEDEARDQPTDFESHKPQMVAASPIIATILGPTIIDAASSSVSLASSTVSSLEQWKSGSEAGTETEEDEGMILVGRPS